MVSIGLCMIVRDEEQTLARCLDSVRGIADEIVVVDTGSVDRTREIAARYGRVVGFVWCDDFSAARNFAFAQARSDYLLWLDADDVLPPDSQTAFRALKAQLADDPADVVMLPYHTAFDAQGKPTFVYYRERLLRRAAGFVWQGAVHECITPRGRVIYGTAAVEHRRVKPADSARNLAIYRKQLAAGVTLDARGQFYYARELLAHRDWRAAEQAFCAFLDRADGWSENRIEALRGLSDCLAAQNRTDEARQALTRSFAIDLPRGETCCALAALDCAENRFDRAKFWYETALRVPCPTENGGFVQPDCYGYLPCLGLCLCCDRLGQYAEAERWNECAATYHPDADAVAYNRRYFASRAQ